MSAYESVPRRRFYRDKRKGMIGGVCAGLADYFGFNLKATRILAVISLFVAGAGALLAYFGTMFLVPAKPEKAYQPDFDPDFRRALRSDPSATMSEVDRRFKKLDSRLARLERYVTSPRFDLDQEFRKL